MIAVAKRALLPALLLGLLALPPAASAAGENDFWTEPRQVSLDDNDIRANTGATEVLSDTDGDPEPLTPFDAGFCRNGQYATSAPSPGDGSIDMSHTVWYRVVGDGHPVTIDLRGSGIDTVVAVYRANGAAPSATTFLKCADDIAIEGGADPDSELTFQSQNGAAYLIQVGAADCDACPDPQGSIDFIAFKAPPNDDRATPALLRTGPALSSRTTGATTASTDPRLECEGVAYSRTVWFRYTAPGPGTATFDANGTFDSLLAVYRGSTFLGCNDDGASGVPGPSRLRIPVTAGDYLVQVGAIGTAPDAEYGTFGASVSFTPAPDPDRDGDKIPDRSDSCPDQSSAGRDANGDGCLDPDPDPDRDGVPVGPDKCPTENAAGRDINHDGCLDPLPPKRISAEVNLRATPTANGIRIRFLKVQAPRGTKVTVRCGRGCRFAKRASASGEPLAVASRTVTVRKLAGRSFRAGQKIRIYVTRRGRIGAFVQYTVKRGGFKKIKRCLNPGSTKPRKRCP